MPLKTDFFEPALTDQVAEGLCSVRGEKLDGNIVVDQIRDTLIAGGWTLVEPVHAHSFLAVAVIFLADPDHPVPEEEKEPADCGGFFWYGCDPGVGAPIAGYDPYRQLPPVGCCFFPFGLTMEDSAQNLADQVGECTPFNAVRDEEISDRYEEDAWKLVASTGGTGLNGYCMGGDLRGIYTHSAEAWGGGWKLRSQTYRGQYLELTATVTAPGYALNGVLLSLTTNTGEAAAATNLDTQHAYDYRVLAGPYQFAVWARNVDGDTFGSQGSSCCLASVPQYDEDKITGTAAVFITSINPDHVIGSNFRSSLTYNPAWSAINGAFQVSDENVGIAGLRLPDHDILTSTPLPVIQNPYVWGAARGEPAFILGKLWDAVLLSSSGIQREAILVWDGVRYICVGRQVPRFGNTSASLLLALP